MAGGAAADPSTGGWGRAKLRTVVRLRYPGRGEFSSSGGRLGR